MQHLLPFPGATGGGGGSVLLAANGWITERDDFVAPFRTLDRRRGVLETVL